MTITWLKASSRTSRRRRMWRSTSANCFSGSVDARGESVTQLQDRGKAVEGHLGIPVG